MAPWALGLLSALFLAFTPATSHLARLAGNFTLQVEARAAAESGLALAAAGLLARLSNRVDMPRPAAQGRPRVAAPESLIGTG